jgi:hypothetical protein
MIADLCGYHNPQDIRGLVVEKTKNIGFFAKKSIFL